MGAIKMRAVLDDGALPLTALGGIDAAMSDTATVLLSGRGSSQLSAAHSDRKEVRQFSFPER